MVDRSYEQAKAVYAVTNFGIDDAIDPANSRTWLTAGVWLALDVKVILALAPPCIFH